MPTPTKTNLKILAFLIVIIGFLIIILDENFDSEKHKAVNTVNIISSDSLINDSNKLNGSLIDLDTQNKGHLKTDYDFFIAESVSKLTDYTIMSIEQNNKIKCVVYIRIKDKINDNFIKLIADDLKRNLNPISNRMHIFYLLPQHQVGNGAWARVDFTPDYQLFYIGQSLAEENKVINHVNQISDAVGIWEDPSENEGLVLRIRKDPAHGLILETILASDPKPSDFASQIKKTVIKGKEVYTEIDNSFGEYYVLESNGDLSLYDNKGYVVTYRKLK